MKYELKKVLGTCLNISIADQHDNNIAIAWLFCMIGIDPMTPNNTSSLPNTWTCHDIQVCKIPCTHKTYIQTDKQTLDSLVPSLAASLLWLISIEHAQSPGVRATHRISSLYWSLHTHSSLNGCNDNHRNHSKAILTILTVTYLLLLKSTRWYSLEQVDGYSTEYNCRLTGK